MSKDISIDSVLKDARKYKNDFYVRMIQNIRIWPIHKYMYKRVDGYNVFDVLLTYVILRLSRPGEDWRICRLVKAPYVRGDNVNVIIEEKQLIPLDYSRCNLVCNGEDLLTTSGGFGDEAEYMKDVSYAMERVVVDREKIIDLVNTIMDKEVFYTDALKELIRIRNEMMMKEERLRKMTPKIHATDIIMTHRAIDDLIRDLYYVKAYQVAKAILKSIRPRMCVSPGINMRNPNSAFTFTI